MNTFLKQINYLIFYQWAKHKFSNNYFEECNSVYNEICCQNDNYVLKLLFYQNGVVEEIILNKSDQEIIYYLHFAFLDFNQGTKMINDLIIHFNSLNNTFKKILICCSCGLTSSFFAYKLQEYINLNKQAFVIDAIGIDTLNKNKEKEYDLILLTPQVNYQKATLINKLKTSIVSIPIRDYACNNYLNVLSIINNNI